MSHRDFLDLRSILPARSGLELGIYHQLLINDFPAGSFRNPGDLCADKGSSSIIFSADEGDDGSLFLFAGCDSEKLLFLAQENILQKIFDQSLICIDSKGFLSSFFRNFLEFSRSPEAFSSSNQSSSIGAKSALAIGFGSMAKLSSCAVRGSLYRHGSMT